MPMERMADDFGSVRERKRCAEVSDSPLDNLVFVNPRPERLHRKDLPGTRSDITYPFMKQSSGALPLTAPLDQPTFPFLLLLRKVRQRRRIASRALPLIPCERALRRPSRPSYWHGP